jgi:hypothetical protein
MTDADIAKQVGSEVGLQVDVDSTSIVRDWVFQNNQTNWEFLKQLADRNGFRLYLKGKETLSFKKVADNGDGQISLVWGEDLRSFRPRVAASPQVNEVVVRGWDPKTKQAISQSATSATGVPTTGGPTQGGQVAQTAFGHAKHVVVDRPVMSEDEAQALATSIIDDIGGGFLEADGLCYAHPKLAPGMTVEVKNIGKRFSGSYFVTATAHTYTPAEGFLTQFSVSGKRSNSVLSVLDGSSLVNRTSLGGNVVVGIVTNNLDPDGLGRVKVRYPWLSPDHESFWVRLVSPMAGAGRGFQFIPEIDDEVLVAFEHGDIHRPYLLGGLWNGKDKPVEDNQTAVTGQKVQHRIIKTRIGHQLMFDDTDGKGQIKVSTTNGHILQLDDKEQQIKITTTAGHVVQLDDKGSKILVQDKTGSNKITIDSNSNAISVECQGNFSVQAQGNVSVKAQGNVSIEGQAGIDIKSPDLVNIKGSMVNIN